MILTALHFYVAYDDDGGADDFDLNFFSLRRHKLEVFFHSWKFLFLVPITQSRMI